MGSMKTGGCRRDILVVFGVWIDWHSLLTIVFGIIISDFGILIHIYVNICGDYNTELGEIYAKPDGSSKLSSTVFYRFQVLIVKPWYVA